MLQRHMWAAYTEIPFSRYEALGEAFSIIAKIMCHCHKICADPKKYIGDVSLGLGGYGVTSIHGEQTPSSMMCMRLNHIPSK